MSRIMIIYGQMTVDGVPPGPTRRGDQLLQTLGCRRLVDEWRPGDLRTLAAGDLVIAHDCTPAQIYAHPWPIGGPLLELVPMERVKADICQ
jgi:hypothetical protein